MICKQKKYLVKKKRIWYEYFSMPIISFIWLKKKGGLAKVAECLPSTEFKPQYHQKEKKILPLVILILKSNLIYFLFKPRAGCNIKRVHVQSLMNDRRAWTWYLCQGLKISSLIIQNSASPLLALYPCDKLVVLWYNCEKTQFRKSPNPVLTSYCSELLLLFPRCQFKEKRATVQSPSAHWGMLLQRVPKAKPCSEELRTSTAPVRWRPSSSASHQAVSVFCHHSDLLHCSGFSREPEPAGCVCVWEGKQREREKERERESGRM
jgi:hypothetical protein